MCAAGVDLTMVPLGADACAAANHQLGLGWTGNKLLVTVLVNPLRRCSASRVEPSTPLLQHQNHHPPGLQQQQRRPQPVELGPRVTAARWLLVAPTGLGALAAMQAVLQQQRSRWVGLTCVATFDGAVLP